MPNKKAKARKMLKKKKTFGTKKAQKAVETKKAATEIRLRAYIEKTYGKIT